MNESITSHSSMNMVEYRQLTRPFVYGWCRKGEYLYIGSTSRGHIRILKHNIIGKVEPMLDTDYIDFWYVPVNDLPDLERKLIEHHRPKHNKVFLTPFSFTRQPTKPLRKAVCSSCGQKFKPLNLQVFLCWSCRNSSLKVDLDLIAQPKPPTSRLVSLPPQ